MTRNDGDYRPYVDDFYSSHNSPRLLGTESSASSALVPLVRKRKTKEFLLSGERWTGGGWRTAASLLYCLTQFLVAVPDAVLGPTLTALGRQVSCVSDNEICPEMLEAIGWNRTGAALSVIVAWILSSTGVNGHCVLSGGLFMVALSFFSAPLSTTATQVHVSFFIIGLGKGLSSLQSTALLVALRQGNPKKLGKWVNLMSIFWGIGSILTPLLVCITTLKDFRLSFVSVGVLFLSQSVVMLYVRSKVPERKRLPSSVRETTATLSGCRANTIMICGFLFAFLALGVEFNIVAYITPFVESQNIASNTIGNLMTTTYSAAFMVGRVLSGYLEVKGPKVSPAVVLDACILLSTLLAGLCCLSGSSVVIIWVCAAGWGLFLSPSWPCTLMLLRQTGEVSDTMVQMFIFSIYSGQWALDLVMNSVIQSFGTRALPYGLLCALLAAFVVASLILLLLSVGGHTEEVEGKGPNWDESSISTPTRKVILHHKSGEFGETSERPKNAGAGNARGGDAIPPTVSPDNALTKDYNYDNLSSNPPPLLSSRDISRGQR
mmetsp:Transcript_30679/g.42735  ORF Transcript_30679/g.42735 Transcript_30679/m.42735 type:complete len:548 (-) Transcript_30679:27-1670(-)